MRERQPRPAQVYSSTASKQVASAESREALTAAGVTRSNGKWEGGGRGPHVLLALLLMSWEGGTMSMLV